MSLGIVTVITLGAEDTILGVSNTPVGLVLSVLRDEGTVSLFDSSVLFREDDILEVSFYVVHSGKPLPLELTGASVGCCSNIVDALTEEKPFYLGGFVMNTDLVHVFATVEDIGTDSDEVFSSVSY